MCSVRGTAFGTSRTASIQPQNQPLQKIVLSSFDRGSRQNLHIRTLINTEERSRLVTSPPRARFYDLGIGAHFRHSAPGRPRDDPTVNPKRQKPSACWSNGHSPRQAGNTLLSITLDNINTVEDQLSHDLCPLLHCLHLWREEVLPDSIPPSPRQGHRPS